ncbi:hypothetical protein PoB_006953500 [Plakobranchus ocellatus]|uniref:Uncharacterized protein n=1 Tax=Plakobranchus ocellatus TaxID=259542 RepID=A0AAV4DFZ7_9GAST|nr:hypothetical protein PoB_006953500 [Plakobranchus ocellatus]
MLKNLTKRRSEFPDKVQNFLRSQFLAPTAKQSDASSPLKVPGPLHSTPLAAESCASTSKATSTVLSEMQPRPDVMRIMQQKITDAKKDSEELQQKISTLTEVIKSLNQQVSDLTMQNSNLQSKVQTLQSIREDTNSACRCHEPKSSKTKSKHYKLVWTLRQKVKSLESAASENKQLKEKLNKLRNEKFNLQKQIHLVKKARDRYKNEKERIDEKLVREFTDTKENNFVPALRCGNRFTDDVRKTVISLLSSCNVSATQCSKAIQAVAHDLFHVHWKITELPSPQTLLTIADEAFVLSKIATVEQLRVANNFTLHVDGTSRYQRKFLGHQLTLDNGKVLSLGFVDVPCEDASTLLDVTVAVLSELGDVYDPDNRETIFKEILIKLHSTMTDRASAMKKFSSSLNMYKQDKLGTDYDIHFLHCNAHFLLGLSSACEGTMKKVEQGYVDKTGRKLGRDQNSKFGRFSSSEAAVSRYIRTACAILGPRGDQKSGCRVEWLAFCEEQQIISRLPSYRSNRFNCYFEAAARLIQLHKSILLFLNSSYLSHNNLLIESVKEDSNDPFVMALVLTLAFMFLQFTGPYWQLMQSKMPFAELYQPIQGMLYDLTHISSNPAVIFDENFKSQLFVAFPPESSLISSFFSFVKLMPQETRNLCQDANCAVSLAAAEVVKRQLADFLPSGSFDFSTKESPLFLHCPVTNLVGENAFGDFDFIMGKHRRTSLFHLSALQSAKQNRVSQWLRTTGKSSQFMAQARRTAAALKAKHREREKQVIVAVRKRMLQNAAEQEKKLAKLAENKRAVIQAVLSHGGPCTSAADVAVLSRRLAKSQLAEALKNEVRYQKLVIGIPGVLRLNKTVSEMSEMLKEHLASSGQQATFTTEELDISSETCDEAMPAAPFTFDRPSTWVAVYYDNSFYVGQVITILQPHEAEVKFLEQTKARSDYFRWPRADDIAKVDAEFVFAWDFNVQPVSSDCRIWQVENVEDLLQSYERIKAAYH